MVAVLSLPRLDPRRISGGMIIIDGSQGEGGGQILRSALTLAMLTKTPFRIEKIRANRRKPGLLRQHLTCVTAAQRISAAKVSGGEIGGTKLQFEPDDIKAGAYDFAIGSAGSTSLVFQTILPALLRAGGPSSVTLSGGTHNGSAPTFDYLEQVYLPLLRRMGASVDVMLTIAGFYPAGGGKWSAAIAPCTQLVPLIIDSSGQVRARRITADVANLPFDVADREAKVAAELLSWPEGTIKARTIKADGPGNVLAITIASEHVTEMFTAFGKCGIAAEAVAQLAVEETRAYLVAQAPVGPHLADQLLLPMALAGTGRIVTSAPTMHTASNIAIIEKFLAVEFETRRLDEHRWEIAVST
jgi:RNA 3'-terminal phosphate cyclase (ATP)